jgi:hypothetical protein
MLKFSLIDSSVSKLNKKNSKLLSTIKDCELIKLLI